MILLDVNVLVYAHRKDAPDHARYQGWLKSALATEPAVGLCDLALSGFLRIVTHPRVFADPTPLAIALQYVVALRAHPRCLLVAPGERHWEIFEHLVRAAQARGNLIPDAFFAALAIESGTQWITTDRDYARFPGLRWRHPLG
jgi:hypothetical protein